MTSREHVVTKPELIYDQLGSAVPSDRSEIYTVLRDALHLNRTATWWTLNHKMVEKTGAVSDRNWDAVQVGRRVVGLLTTYPWLQMSSSPSVPVASQTFDMLARKHELDDYHALFGISRDEGNLLQLAIAGRSDAGTLHGADITFEAFCAELGVEFTSDH